MKLEGELKKVVEDLEDHGLLNHRTGGGHLQAMLACKDGSVFVKEAEEFMHKVHCHPMSEKAQVLRRLRSEVDALRGPDRFQTKSKAKKKKKTSMFGGQSKAES